MKTSDRIKFKLKNNAEKIKPTKKDKVNKWITFGTIIILTICTRYYKVTEPDHVCWDETHFGKMGSWYINRTFFFDVHPPLGKMLIGLSGYVTGYNGTYPFEKPGDKYNGSRYEGMRYFCTTLGALIMPMAFDTVYELTQSTEAAVISSLYLIFDVGLVTLNQYILLDPILLFFLTASVWGMTKASNLTETGNSYTLSWWVWLFFTGTMLACTTSTKFVGLFVVMLVGLHTIQQLWIIFGDMRKPITETVKQIACRTIALILWPIILYMYFFYIHLIVLNRSGTGDGFYSSAFQSRLIGNSLYNVSMPRDVTYGAIVTIKNHKTGGGYLHSHYHLYPKGIGARQQQVTTYTHKDDNNKWLIKPYNKDSIDNLKYISHGALIRLEHVATRRNLHSHGEPAPLTKRHLQITGYGEDGQGDANDIWQVLLVDGKQNTSVKTVTTKFLLIHYLQNCALTTSGQQLPKWGFEQQEVSCNPNLRDKNAFWNVEDNRNEKLPTVNLNMYAPSFLSTFMESHAVMFQGNAGLKPKEGELTSKPWQWPINYRGQYFSGSSYRIYLLGNPIIWWSNLAFLILFVLVSSVTIIKQRRLDGRRFVERNCAEETYSNNGKQEKQQTILNAAFWLFTGWITHYVPFWTMGRILYFHHYFPAVIFNSMLAGVMFKYVSSYLPKWVQHTLLGGMISGLAYSFKLFSPLAYGMSGPLSNEHNSTMYGLRWLSSWEF
ncbi:protein O-mannosyl-transferase 2 isoform X2 [Bactrocera dorsalis]|uniref:Protein O-mannosyl-transferase 2 n=1 Tax=Bactrocera dorsalis TaxID=27457 RepID=A0ABM3J9L2_BACDO|nr:protein O-mannosyl-transferase 2 isoform X2 [Bactrocera dorsalis]